MACNDLGWWPAEAHTDERRLRYLWRLTHTAPPKVRQIHETVSAPQALKRAANRGAKYTTTWTQLVQPLANKVHLEVTEADRKSWHELQSLSHCAWCFPVSGAAVQQAGGHGGRTQSEYSESSPSASGFARHCTPPR